MPIANVFESDVFDVIEMTAAINKMEYLPQEISDWLPWNTESVSTCMVAIEQRGNSFDIVEARPLGAPPAQIEDDDREAIPLLVPHYPTEITVQPGEVQGVRAFGTDATLETATNVRDRKLLKARRSHAATLEFTRAGAIQGKIPSKSGATIVDLFEKFGVVQTQHDIDFTSGNTDVLAELIEAKEKSEQALGAYMVEGYMLPVGPALYKSIVSHPSVFKAWERWQDGARFRADNRKGFEVVEGVFLASYNKGIVGSTRFMPSDEGFLCPIAEDMYQTRLAPANHMQFVNTPGLPVYVIPGRSDDYDSGFKAKVEANHVSWVNEPTSIVRIKQG